MMWVKELKLISNHLKIKVKEIAEAHKSILEQVYISKKTKIMFRSQLYKKNKVLL
jgi:hypothetical protein